MDRKADDGAVAASAVPSESLLALHARLRAQRGAISPRPATPAAPVPPPRAAAPGGVDAFLDTLAKSDPALAELFRDVVDKRDDGDDAAKAVDRWTVQRAAQRAQVIPANPWADAVPAPPPPPKRDDDSDSEDDEAPRSRADEAELLAVLQSVFMAGGLQSMPSDVVARLAAIEGVLVDRAGDDAAGKAAAEDGAAAPSAAGTDLHRAVFCGSFAAVRALFRGARLGMAMLEVRDGRGNTPLLLALKRGRGDVASFLVHAGASVDVKSDEHFHLMDDAVSLGDAAFVRLAHTRLQRGVADRFDERRAQLLDVLQALPDFSFQMDCALATAHRGAILAPLVAAMNIGDTYTIRKRGSWLRADSTVSGVDLGGWLGGRKAGQKSLPSLERGALSLLFVGRDDFGGKLPAAHRGEALQPGDVIIIDRVKKTADSVLRRMKAPTAAEVDAAVKKLVKQTAQPLYSLAYNSQPLTFEARKAPRFGGGGLARHVAKTEVSVAMFKKSGAARHAPLSDVSPEAYFGAAPATSAKRVRSMRKRVEVRVDTSDALPLSLADVLPVFHIASLHDDAFFKRLESLLGSSTLPRTAFPAKIKVPLFLGVAAKLKFVDVERTAVEASVFAIPADVEWQVAAKEAGGAAAAR